MALGGDFDSSQVGLRKKRRREDGEPDSKSQRKRSRRSKPDELRSKASVPEQSTGSTAHNDGQESNTLKKPPFVQGTGESTIDSQTDPKAAGSASSKTKKNKKRDENRKRRKHAHAEAAKGAAKNAESTNDHKPDADHPDQLQRGDGQERDLVQNNASPVDTQAATGATKKRRRKKRKSRADEESTIRQVEATEVDLQGIARAAAPNLSTTNSIPFEDSRTTPEDKQRIDQLDNGVKSTKHTKMSRKERMRSRIQKREGKLGEHGDQNGQESSHKTLTMAPQSTNLEVGAEMDHFDTSKSWVASDVSGGRLLDISAVFSQDERHIMFGTEGSVISGSIQTSIVERSQELAAHGTITCIAASQSRRGSVFVATLSGSILLWKWAGHAHESRVTELSRRKRSITAIATVRVPNQSQELLFAAETSNHKRELTVQGTNSSTGTPKSILKCKEPIQSLKVASSGQIVVAATVRRLFIGRLSRDLQVDSLEESLEQLEYSWLEIACKLPPTCFDLQFRPSVDRIRSSEVMSGVTSDDHLTVAYGSLKGNILLHSNVFASIGGKGASPRELHWHRQSVPALAFSPDGNYLISGGQETVLVVWQLDTGNKTFLPHLESPIKNLSISPSGSLYAVGLADNSLMVLTTAEMKPIAHFASLQSPSTSSITDYSLIVPTKEAISAYLEGKAATNIPAAINPTDPSQLLLPAPSFQSANMTLFPHTPPSPYLQTYSTFRNLHISRQALTRTNATSTNLGPEGNKLKEPNIAHIATTPNGNWLATIDEWEPPREDLHDLIIDPEDMPDEIAKQREVTLRIWHWNANEKTWMLNTSIPSPHQSGQLWHIHSRVLELRANPAESAFTSVGEDGVIRTWAPKTRTPDGRTFRGENAPQREHRPFAKSDVQTWWAVQHEIPLERRMQQDDLLTTLTPRTACLAWSDDGSLLAAWLGYPHAPKTPSRRLVVPYESDQPMALSDEGYETSNGQDTVHFIDTDLGIIKDSCPYMLSSQDRVLPIETLAFAGRYLLVMSRAAVHIWDVPLCVLHLSTSLPAFPVDAPSPHLAVNSQTNTFAVTIPTPKPIDPNASKDVKNLPPHAHRDFQSRLLVYSLPVQSIVQDVQTTGVECLMSAILPSLALSLLSASGCVVTEDGAKTTADINDALRKGYLVIDSRAFITRIRPPIVSKALSKAIEEASAQDAMEVDDAETGDDGMTLGPSLAPDRGFAPDRQIAQEESEDDEDVTEFLNQPRVVPSEKLAEAIGDREGKPGEDVMAGPLPSVRDMYERVVGLFWGRSRPQQ